MIRNRAQIAEKVRLLIGDGTLRAYSASATPAINDGGTVVPSDVLNFPDGSSRVLSDAMYGRFVSTAYLNVAKQNNWAEYEYTTSTVASTAHYAADAFTTIFQVDYDNLELQPMNAAMLYRLDEKWQTRTGRPIMWLLGQKTQWGYGGTSVLGSGAAQSEGNRAYQTVRLYPTPTAAVDLRIIGIAKPEPLISDLDSPYLPGWMHDAVVYEAAAQILESHTELRNPALAQLYRGMRDRYIELGLQRRGNREYGMMTIRGEYNRSAWTLYRTTHIPYTGLAPGTPE